MEKKVKQFEIWLNEEIANCHKSVKAAEKNNNHMLPRFKHDLVEATYIKRMFESIFNDEKKQEKIFEELISELRQEVISYKVLQKENQKEAAERKTNEWQMFHYGKVDAYELVINSLIKLINTYNGKKL